MRHFENLNNFNEQDWVLLLEASRRLVEIGVITQFLVKPFFIALAHKLAYATDSTTKSDPFLGYITVDHAYDFLKKRPMSQVAHVELPKVTALGFVLFLTMATILHKALKVDERATDVDIADCMEFLAQDISDKANNDEGSFFKSESLRKNIITTFESFFLKEDLFFIQDILSEIAFQGDVLFNINREKAILLFCIHESTLIQSKAQDI